MIRLLNMKQFSILQSFFFEPTNRHKLVLTSAPKPSAFPNFQQDSSHLWINHRWNSYILHAVLSCSRECRRSLFFGSDTELEKATPGHLFPPVEDERALLELLPPMAVLLLHLLQARAQRAQVLHLGRERGLALLNRVVDTRERPSKPL
jgi:hypothetical protein